MSFSYNKKDCIKRARAITLTQIKVNIILGSISLLLGVYFLLIGFLEDFEAMIFGVPLVLITLFMFITCFCRYNNYKKAVNLSFEKRQKDEQVTFVVETNENLLKVICKETEEVFELKKLDIKKVYYLKQFIIVKLNTNKIIDFPRLKELETLLKP